MRRGRKREVWMVERRARENGKLKDMKRMRRDRSGDWTLVQKMFRNMILQERFNYMKNTLEKARELGVFRMVKPLERRRAVPLMENDNRDTVFEHDKISNMIAEQLCSYKGAEWVEEVVEIEVEGEELRAALKASPTNIAGGWDKMSYPLLRFWKRKSGEKMLRIVKDLTKRGCKDWHQAERVLIRKGDKERYHVVKSWRMIHLLPVLAKVVEQIILQKLTKQVDLEETQYR